jgi:hypothetical protein
MDQKTKLVQRGVKDLTRIERKLFDVWWNAKGFETIDDISERVYDTSKEFFAAIGDLVRLDTMNPDKPSWELVLATAIEYLEDACPEATKF